MTQLVLRTVLAVEPAAAQRFGGIVREWVARAKDEEGVEYFIRWLHWSASMSTARSAKRSVISSPARSRPITGSRHLWGESLAACA
jgi:hypothetical protein